MNIVFDFGAVLFTWRPVDIVAEVFPDRAGNAAQAKTLAHALFGHDDWLDFDRGLLSLQAVVERTAYRLGIQDDVLRALFESIPQRLVPMPDSLAIMQALAQRQARGDGVRALYFLSNMPVPYARALEQEHDFLRAFDGGIFSGDARCSKPDPRIYELLQSRYGLAAPDTVFIDDMPGNVEAACAMGWRGIHFTSAQQLQADLALHCGL